MTEQEYIVLRTERLSVPVTGNLGGQRGSPMAQPGSLAEAAESLEIRRETLSKQARDDLRRDPRTQAMAQPMPLSLVEPMEPAEAPPAGALAARNTWGIEAIGAHLTAFDGTGVKVAVLDTGIDPQHPAFTGVSLTRRNFTAEGDDDSNGHGTHCAGTIFGRDVDNLRIGVARGVSEAVIGKVLGQGGGSSASLVQAIQWAVDEGAHIVSMSLGIDFPGFVKFLIDRGFETQPATSIALEQYRDNVNLFSRLADLLVARNGLQQSGLIIAASGNESRRPQYEIAVAPPAAGTGILSVGALAEGDAAGHAVANFSNTQCDVSGPGVGVISAWPGGGLKSLGGTSMATPHVAGTGALWAQKQRQQLGSVSSELIKGQILGNATFAPLIAGSERDDVGAGIVVAP